MAIFLQHEEPGFSPLGIPLEILFARGEVNKSAIVRHGAHLASDFPPVGYHDFVAFLTASENADIFNKLLHVYYRYCDLYVYISICISGVLRLYPRDGYEGFMCRGTARRHQPQCQRRLRSL